MPFEQDRDRPNLGYVKGKNWSLAIDAGHSAAHTKEFYALLEKENLPLPCLTVLTHWHWDHTFGMHAANGLSIANEKTNRHLAKWKNKIEKNGPALCKCLADPIRQLNPQTCVEGHWVPVETDDTLSDLLGGV